MKKQYFFENAILLNERFGVVPFMYGSLEQYLKVYTSSSKDGYRIHVRKKKDADKISFIQKHLK